MSHLGISLASWYVNAPTPEIGKWRLRAWLLRALRKAGWSRTAMITTKFGCRMELNLRDWVDQHIFAHGVYEPELTQIVTSVLRPGDRFIDLGANIGYFTVLASKLVGPTGQVVAFEPVPATRTRLMRNMELNRCGNVELHSEAASDRAATVHIHVGPSDHSGISSLRPLSESGGDLSVETIRLENVPALRVPPRLIKIDVEGAEMHVVRGFGDLWDVWANDLPDFLIEVSQSYLKAMGDSAADLFTAFKQQGYRHFRIEWNRLVEISDWDSSLPDQYNAYLTRRGIPASLQHLVHSGEAG